jgi:purine-nucleoside phosphorylase
METNRTLRDIAEDAAVALTRLLEDWEQPAAFVQTGSGTQTEGLFDEILDELAMAYLPGMPSTASPAGHELKLILGRCGDRRILLAKGRRHLYEGLGFTPCVLPVCAAVLAGVKRVVLVCAAGSVNPEFRPGSYVALIDYINNLGSSPLVGPEPLGEKYFLPMTEAYSQNLVSEFINCMPPSAIRVRLGVYQANLGPQYETPAEVEVARRNGADLVGMSTVPETMVARALGAEVMGLAVVTNLAAGRSVAAPTHEEVGEVASSASPVLMSALNRFLKA